MAQRGISVLGATGYTGRLIASELHRRGVPFVAAGRNGAKLSALAAELSGVETLQADVHDAASLAALAQRSRVIINCAGPFIDYGEPVVKAAIEHGSHYLDTTGEQPFMRAMLAHDEWARQQKVAVVSAQAFEIAVSDCAATLAAEGFRDIASVHVFYATTFHASQGTQRTVLRMLQSSGYAYLHGDWAEEGPARVSKSVDLPAPLGRRTAVSFPSAEIITIPRHIQTREVRVFFALPSLVGALVSGAAPWVGRLMKTPLAHLAARAVGSGTDGPDEKTRSGDDFHLIVDVRGVRHGKADVQRLVVSGRDPYGITATVAAAGALWMNGDGYDRCGVLAPAQAFEPTAVLKECEPFGVTWRRDDWAG